MYSTQQNGEPTWESLKDQIDRLAQLDGFPKPEFQASAYRELVIALQNADTLADAKQFIDDVMMCEMVCPKPTQIREMIWNARDAKKPAERVWDDNIPPAQRIANWPKDSDDRFNRHLDLLRAVVDKKLPPDHALRRIELRELTAQLKADYPHLLRA